MTLPHLTFFCELEAKPLQALFAGLSLEDFSAMNARISLGILDRSPERAAVVRRLNQAHIPVIAWLLLPREQGYWFNLDNAPQAAASYVAFQEWTAEQGLQWAGIGLDIEPDIREMEQWAVDKFRLLPVLVQRSLNSKRLQTARTKYSDLVEWIHADGYPVECYQFPLIADERKSGSTLLQRLAGLVDIPVDREVWMLYTSFNHEDGVGMLNSYGPEAQAIGLGSTGGGVETGVASTRPLTWKELARDLRLAWYWSDQIYIFSLEGCASQGFLDRLKTFEWDQPILLPEEATQRVDRWRKTLGLILWTSAHAKVLLAGSLSLLAVYTGLRRFLKCKSRV